MLYTASGSIDPSHFTKMLGLPKSAGFLDGLVQPEKLPDWLRDDDLEVYASTFERTGFRGGLNWYRNFDRNWELTPELSGVRVEVPALFVAGAGDPVLGMASLDPMREWVTDLRDVVLVAGAGHWVQQEEPEAVNAALLQFLSGLDA